MQDGRRPITRQYYQITTIPLRMGGLEFSGSVMPSSRSMRPDGWGASVGWGFLFSGGSWAPRSLAPILPLPVLEPVLLGSSPSFFFEGHRIFVRALVVSLQVVFEHSWRVVTGSRTRHHRLVMLGTSILSV